MLKTLSLIILAGVIAAGCSSHKLTAIGSERLVESSGNKPGWIKKIPGESDEYYFFRGFKTGALSLEDGLTDARSNAIRQVLEMIQAQGLIDYKKARVETGLAETRDDVGSVTEDGLKILSKTVANGVKELESYTEKVERYTPGGIRYFFNVYTLVRYPIAEYDKAVALAARGTQAEIRRQNNAQAQEVLEALDKGLPTY
ncbi:MAG: hypothetical protein FVQ81_02820 [Candidatus Glassbacteria bacterium]|nr:hypothetical protein [Candidatus Glassbacteria bacterium]